MKVTDEMVERALSAFKGRRMVDPPWQESEAAMRAALEAVLTDVPPWVEQLAEQWEAEGAKLETMDVPNAEAVLIKCAAELRARAKGEKP